MIWPNGPGPPAPILDVAGTATNTEGGSPMLAWFIAGGSTAALIALWFFIVYRELSRRRHNVECAARQLKFGQAALEQTRAGPDDDGPLRQMWDTDRRIYAQTAREYNTARLLFPNRFPGWVMGFQVAAACAETAQAKGPHGF